MRAFSLVELSIVLVILGLLVGGILAGKSLIRAAELRSLTNDLSKLQTAIHSSRDKYFALPGDMTNATNFWTAAGSPPTGSNCFDANITPTNGGTCNGNGDGGIHYTGESWLFFEHLALAGLIEGNYAGGNQLTPHGKVLVRGINTYEPRMSNIAIQAANSTAYGQTRNFLIVAGNQHAGSVLVTPAINSQEAWNLDVKIDDGKATYGKFLAGNGYNMSGGTYTAWCTSNGRIDLDAAGSGDYTNLNNALGTGCQLYYAF